MGFGEAIYAVGHRHTKSSAVNLSLYKDKEGKRTSLGISVSADVARKLGWKAKDKVLFREGDGPDAMMIQFQVDSSGRGYTIDFQGDETKNMRLRISVSRLIRHRLTSGKNVEVSDSTGVEYQAFGGTLTILLPDTHFCAVE